MQFVPEKQEYRMKMGRSCWVIVVPRRLVDSSSAGCSICWFIFAFGILKLTLHLCHSAWQRSLRDFLNDFQAAALLSIAVDCAAICIQGFQHCIQNGVLVVAGDLT